MQIVGRSMESIALFCIFSLPQISKGLSFSKIRSKVAKFSKWKWAVSQTESVMLSALSSFPTKTGMGPFPCHKMAEI